MIDLHTHTFLSDGGLSPAEQIRRAEVRGYRVLGMADHADLSLFERILPVVVEAARRENERGKILVLPGIELTHVRPEHIAEATREARRLGARVVLCHGETLAEPVEPGTNRAAIEAGVDILTHPGLLREEDARRAAAANVMLEISAKGGHCLTNGHVAAVARAAGARLIFGSDAHGPEGMKTRAEGEAICRGAGLDGDEIAAMFEHAEAFARQRYQQQEADENADW